MKNFVCGITIKGENPEAALSEVMPTPRLIQEIMISESIKCVETPGVGIDFLGWFLPLTFIAFVILGFILGCKHQDDKRPVYLGDNPDHD